MSNIKTILFVTLDVQGCINPSLAIAQVLVKQGHRVVFVIEKVFEGKLAPHGIKEEILPSLDANQNEKEEENWPKFIADNAQFLKETPFDVLEGMSLPCSSAMTDAMMAREKDNKRIIERIKPDMLVLDTFFCSPALTNSNIPWIRVSSANPTHALEDDRLPPSMSGLPSGGENRQEWEKFQERKKKIFIPLWNRINDWVKSLGAPALPPNPRLHPDSPYANLYLTPKEIDLYNENLPAKPNWFPFDSLIRETQEEFVLPQNFANLPGKLIYLSMGTIGSAYVELMEKLVDFLKDSPNKFIVSKGMFGEKYELESNMWGKNSLPQTKVSKQIKFSLIICPNF
jgi:UDP:flavonoid glycosyltransferase YjiC (YdhE family)